MLKQVSDEETMEILRIAGDSLSNTGDFVELGCYEGDTSLLLAEIIRKNPEKKLWIFDSFEGLPEKTSEDFSEAGKNFRAGELKVSKRYVKQRFLRANLPVPVIKKAWFNELNPSEDLPEQIGFAFLDGDLYDSIKTSLELVSPKMTKNSVIIVHDFFNPELPGVTKAVEEFLMREKSFEFSQKFSLGILRKK